MDLGIVRNTRAMCTRRPGHNFLFLYLDLSNQHRGLLGFIAG